MNRTDTTTERLLKELKSKGGISSIILNYLKIPNFSMKENSLVLLKYGWYIQGNFELKKTTELIELFKSEKIEDAENILKAFFNNNLNKIKKGLINKHNERINVINEAFDSHEKGMFFSSTILFLTQADGISETKMFRDSKKFAKKIDSKKNPKFVSILKEESPLNVDTRKDANPNFFSNLNRHAVMHGLSDDYGCEKNSFKALSLLCFVSDFYNRYE